MTVPTTSAGSRSGVNWMRWNFAETVSHSVRDGQRLGEAGHAFEQHVAAGQQADQQPLDHVLLADDDAADFGENGVDEGALALHELVDGSDVAVHALLGRGPRAEAKSPGALARRRAAKQHTDSAGYFIEVTGWLGCRRLGCDLLRSMFRNASVRPRTGRTLRNRGVVAPRSDMRCAVHATIAAGVRQPEYDLQLGNVSCND